MVGKGPVGAALDALEKAGLKGLTEFMVKEATGAAVKDVKAHIGEIGT